MTYYVDDNANSLDLPYIIQDYSYERTTTYNHSSTTARLYNSKYLASSPQQNENQSEKEQAKEKNICKISLHVS